MCDDDNGRRPSSVVFHSHRRRGGPKRRGDSNLFCSFILLIRTFQGRCRLNFITLLYLDTLSGIGCASLFTVSLLVAWAPCLVGVKCKLKDSTGSKLMR